MTAANLWQYGFSNPGHIEAGGRDRSLESIRPDGVGGPDEQYPQPGGINHPARIGVRLIKTGPAQSHLDDALALSLFFS